MSKLQILLPRWTPTGDVSFGQVRDGQFIQRPWQGTVNGKFNVQSYLDQGVFDPVNVADAQDCLLLINGQEALEVIEWEPVVSQTTAEFTPAGERQTIERMVKYKVTLALTEYVVRDALLLTAFVAGLQPGARRLEADFLATYAGPLS